MLNLRNVMIAFLILMVMIGLTSLFQWAFGGVGVFIISIVYFFTFLFFGFRFWQFEEGSKKTLGGLLCLFAVGMIPLMVYGVVQYMMIEPWAAYSQPGNVLGLSEDDFYRFARILTEFGIAFASGLIFYQIRFYWLLLPLAISLIGLLWDVSHFLV